MVSAERVMAYGKLRSEEASDSLSTMISPPSSWPDKGRIEITDLCYRHSTNSPVVLNNINCTIESGEKVYMHYDNYYNNVFSTFSLCRLVLLVELVLANHL